MKYKNLILSGGGVRGLYYLSLLKYFEDINYDLNNFKNLVGTSIGSFIAMAISIGYNSNSLKQHLINVLDYSRVKSLNIFNILNNFGLDNGSKLEHFIKKMIRDKIGRKDITFIELYNIYNKNLIITTVCLEEKNVIYLNKEKNPNMKIWKAIRMSMSVPFIFKPFIYRNLHYVDGGIKHNFAIELYNSCDTLGIDLSGQKRENNKMNFEEFLFSIIDTIIKASNDIKLQDVIIINNSFNPENPLLSFQPNLDEKIICEALEYSYKAISEYFKSREKTIYNFCESIINESINSIH